ncbi:MAG: hypothetical protein H0V72_06870 [Bradyrhizobium sp.]|nr:hypothetical protein [Bradyrhizobium sp.]
MLLATSCLDRLCASIEVEIEVDILDSDGCADISEGFYRRVGSRLHIADLSADFFSDFFSGRDRLGGDLTSEATTGKLGRPRQAPGTGAAPPFSRVPFE